MDLDFELVIYIIFVLVAIFSRVLRKKKQEQADPGRDSDHGRDSGPQQERTMTFEDLLKEFTDKAQKPNRPEPVREPVSLEELEFKDRIPDDQEIAEVFEESVKAAEDAKPLSEIEQNRSFGHFKEFKKEEETNELAGEIRDMLSRPRDAAKAVVLSEIINRKHF